MNAVSTFGDGAVVGASVAGFLVAVVALFSTFSQPIATARVHAFTVPADLTLRANFITAFIPRVHERDAAVGIGLARVRRCTATILGRCSGVLLGGCATV